MINPVDALKHMQTKEWHDVVQKFTKLSNYKNALDIGTASGLSSWSIAQRGSGNIVSIDIKAQRNARRLAEHYGYKNRITFFNGTSDDFFAQNKEMFDLIIVDGSHKFPEVQRDAINGWKVLNKGGYMVFDDYNHPRLKSDIQPAVANFCKETGARITQITNKAYAQKK